MCFSVHQGLSLIPAQFTSIGALYFWKESEIMCHGNQWENALKFKGDRMWVLENPPVLQLKMEVFFKPATGLRTIIPKISRGKKCTHILWYLSNAFVSPTVQCCLNFFSICTTTLTNLFGLANWSPESPYAYACFSHLWLILLNSCDLVVVVKQSMCLGRRSNHFQGYRQELHTTGRWRYQALCEGVQTLEQVVKTHSGIFIPGNSHPLSRPGAICCSWPCSEPGGLEGTISRGAHLVTVWSACALGPEWD